MDAAPVMLIAGTKFFEGKGAFMSGSDNDMRAHRETYEGVMGLLKWGTIASALVGIVVILIIGR
jgi:Bacterial aa3 type cytochrome c oxidase subunit IV